jgi:hypothetical protein
MIGPGTVCLQIIPSSCPPDIVIGCSPFPWLYPGACGPSSSIHRKERSRCPQRLGPDFSLLWLP